MNWLCRIFGHKWSPMRESHWTVFNYYRICQRCREWETHYIDKRPKTP